MEDIQLTVLKIITLYEMGDNIFAIAYTMNKAKLFMPDGKPWTPVDIEEVCKASGVKPIKNFLKEFSDAR